MFTRRKLLVGLGLGALAPAIPLLAQQGKVWRIGMLEATPAAENALNLDAFRKSLRDLGYVEGRNLVIDYRSVDGRTERYADLAKDLVGARCDVIITRGTQAVLAVKSASQTIPVVMAAVGDPVKSGVVKSLSRPGGNITGLSSFADEIWAKRVELLMEAFPGIVRIAQLENPGNPLVPPLLEEVASAARARGAQAQFFELRKAEDLLPAFNAALKWRAGALVVGIDIVPRTLRKPITEFAARHRLPAVYGSREFVDVGGLMSYGVSYPGLYARAAVYVDKILKGAKPGDLPIEQPTKLELIINLSTLKTLGVTIPLSVRLRADEVVE